ncbi:MAG: hypothetical protein QM730_00025 [Anaerolineales bacterium]
MEQNQIPAGSEAQERPIPWSAAESWIGVVLLILLNVVLILFVKGGSGAQLAQSAAIVFAELAYILPVVIILVWKRISWKYLGFGGFTWSTMAIGCGMLIVGYGIILVHNVILMLLGVDTQGKQIFDIFSSIEITDMAFHRRRRDRTSCRRDLFQRLSLPGLSQTLWLGSRFTAELVHLCCRPS